MRAALRANTWRPFTIKPLPPKACETSGQLAEFMTDTMTQGRVLPLLFEGVLEHFDPPHQVLFHILLPFSLAL